VPTNSIRNILKVVGINLSLTIFILGILIIIPAGWSDISNLYGHKIKALSEKNHSGSGYNIPNYDNQPWIGDLYYESDSLKTRYYDFIGWRRKAFSGKTITIDENGFRRHSSKAIRPEDAEVWVFGGSTIWGTGSPDEFTIPAILEKITGESTFNFGEGGYVAHQSLNLLMRQYVAGGKPKTVIFYDGVNDVSHKCRTELGFYSTEHEQDFRERIESGDSKFLSLLKPVIKPFTRERFGNGKHWFDCHLNTEKSNLIAKNLVQDWLIAKNLVEANGGRFIPVLQPVSHIGKPNNSYLKSSRGPMLKLQYESIYPRVKEELKKRNVEYFDLTNIFDSQEKIYIDFCHVTPSGNQKIASAIANLMSRGGSRRTE